MKTEHLLPLFTLGLPSTLKLQLSIGFAQGTAYAHQGRLSDDANPAAGICDLRLARRRRHRRRADDQLGSFAMGEHYCPVKKLGK
jgi:hypothetical protein